MHLLQDTSKTINTEPNDFWIKTMVDMDKLGEFDWQSREGTAMSFIFIEPTPMPFPTVRNFDNMHEVITNVRKPSVKM